MNHITDFNSFYKVQQAYEWSKWSKEIPFIPFKPNWLVKPIPPMQQAIFRFCVTTKFMQSRNLNHISIYLDCYDLLGSYSQPYWEIFPFHNDTYRCAMNQVDDLVDTIQIAINEQLINIANVILGEEHYV
jgi:hypothetical protein